MPNPNLICPFLLIGHSNEVSQWVVNIENCPFTVGRKTECGLQLNAEGISRLHAEIWESGGFWWIKDCDSTNGTFVNRRRLVGPHMLKPSDLIQFANVQFQVEEKPEFGYTERTSQLIPLAEPFERMLEMGEVTPYCQPIVRFSDSAVVAYELLGRTHYESLPNAPLELFDIARKLGMEVELSRLFREQNFYAAHQFNPSAVFFFNMLPTEMDIPSIKTAFAAVRIRYPDLKLVMELNESVVTNLRTIHELRQVLKDFKILLSYDDFGAGQARLLELMEAPPDIIKFDMSLIRDIHLRPASSQVVLSALVKMAKDIGVRTLAEGVETLYEAKICQQMGFELAQGYFFGKPVPIGG